MKRIYQKEMRQSYKVNFFFLYTQGASGGNGQNDAIGNGKKHGKRSGKDQAVQDLRTSVSTRLWFYPVSSIKMNYICKC